MALKFSDWDLLWLALISVPDLIVWLYFPRKTFGGVSAPVCFGQRFIEEKVLHFYSGFCFSQTLRSKKSTGFIKFGTGVPGFRRSLKGKLKAWNCNILRKRNTKIPNPKMLKPKRPKTSFFSKIKYQKLSWYFAYVETHRQRRLGLFPACYKLI